MSIFSHKIVCHHCVNTMIDVTHDNEKHILWCPFCGTIFKMYINRESKKEDWLFPELT